MRPVQYAAIESALDSIKRRAADLEARVSRTPGRWAAYPLAAPPRRYAWLHDRGDGRDLLVQTDRHGPVGLLRVVGDSEWVEAEALVPDSSEIANPNMAGRAFDELRIVLSRIGHLENATAADQAYLLEESLETAAILLLDPDTLARQEQIRAYMEREKIRRESYVELCDWSYRGGAPGLGKRS